MNDRKKQEDKQMLGIIGAMDEEVAQIKEKMTDVTVTSVAGMDFIRANWAERTRLWFALVSAR